MTHYDGQYEDVKERGRIKIRQLSRVGVTSGGSESFFLTRTIIGCASSVRENKRKRHPIERKKPTRFTIARENGTRTCVRRLRRKGQPLKLEEWRVGLSTFTECAVEV